MLSVSAGGSSACNGEPCVVTKPAAFSRSFTPIGMPASGPGSSPRGDALVDRGRLGHRAVSVEGDERIDRRIHRLDARQRVRGQVPGGELPGTNLAGQVSE